MQWKEVRTMKSSRSIRLSVPRGSGAPKEDSCSSPHTLHSPARHSPRVSGPSRNRPWQVAPSDEEDGLESRGNDPTRKRKYKPPLMLYGWPVNFDRLLRIAEDRDQLYFENIVDLVGDLDGPAEDIQEVISQELDRSLTVECLVRALGKELSPCPPKGLKLWMVINHPNLVIISIYSNYDLVKPTSDEFVERLRVALGEEERPRWYLNDELCYWRRHGSSI
ncbi:hypothetical protein B0H21DRAFT_123752 [Amylocystis lapponica]|nr:hypothetical protein B0H21DRAFT_123752 [Amylocystis lapponica]